MSPSRPGLPRPEALHRQVARNIRNDIEAGVLRDGEALPTTRELAQRWGVSVFTISDAMKLLAEEGLVVSKSRSKRVVRAPGRPRADVVRLRRPHAVLIGGYAGSGKTALGKILAHLTGWPLLDKDSLTRPVVEAALEALGQSPHDRESPTYLTKVRPREYEALANTTIENLACRNSAIVAAPFIREFTDTVWIERTQAAYAAMDATTTLVWMYCDADTMHTYLRHRGAARDAAKLADWPGYLGGMDLDFRPPVPHLIVDNCASGVPLQGQAKALLASILQGDST